MKTGSPATIRARQTAAASARTDLGLLLQVLASMGSALEVQRLRAQARALRQALTANRASPSPALLSSVNSLVERVAALTARQQLQANRLWPYTRGGRS